MKRSDGHHLIASFSSGLHPFSPQPNHRPCPIHMLIRIIGKSEVIFACTDMVDTDAATITAVELADMVLHLC